MIELANVQFSYAGQARSDVTLADINLLIENGSCVVVCGASGCGKTTVTRVANGLAPSFFPGTLHGQVIVDGESIDEMKSWQVALHVGSVFQNPRTQFFNMDSTDEVAFGLESQGLPEKEVRERTDATIATLGLEHLAHRSIFDLSGGEKQRIAYASIWATRPKNLVLDEPTSNLDFAAISDLRKYLLAAKKEGVAILVAEHRLWWLADVADYVACMQQGRIERLMTMDEFKQLGDTAHTAMGLRSLSLQTIAGHEDGVQKESAPLDTGSLAVSGLAGGYKDHPVLSRVDLTCHAGEVVVLVGPNGAGKSTLCRMLVGLHKEDAGEVCLNGKPMSAHQRLHRCSLVFQDVNYQLFAPSVREEVNFGLEGDSVLTDDEVDELLDSLGLATYANVHPALLSGGQKQRLAVASCLASGAEVLIFDEPTSGLDCAGMKEVAALMRGLARHGHIVLVVTHDLEFIAAAGDRVIELAGGYIQRSANVAYQMDEIFSMVGIRCES